MADKIKERIERLTDQLAKAKAQQILKAQAAKTRREAKSRAARNHRIFRLGGMVEKMGLDDLDEALFLGMLDYMGEGLSGDKAAELSEKFKQRGALYLKDGKRKARP